jgi:hypothetical protein
VNWKWRVHPFLFLVGCRRKGDRDRGKKLVRITCSELSCLAEVLGLGWDSKWIEETVDSTGPLALLLIRNLVFFFCSTGTLTWASPMLGKHFITELHPPIFFLLCNLERRQLCSLLLC